MAYGSGCSTPVILLDKSRTPGGPIGLPGGLFSFGGKATNPAAHSKTGSPDWGLVRQISCQIRWNLNFRTSISAYHGGKIGKERCPSAAPSLSALGQIHEPGRCQRVGSHISANELYRKRMTTYLDVVIICYNVAMCAAFSDVCSFVSRYLESLEGLSRPAH